MNRVAQNLALSAILLGQLALTAQTIAMPPCDAQRNHGDMTAGETSLHDDHADRTTQADAKADADADHGGATASCCSCSDGSYCGQLTLVTPAATTAPYRLSIASHYPRNLLERPSLAHRRDPDRPPA